MAGFKHVTSGDPIPRSARFYNALIDKVNEPGGDRTAPPEIPKNLYTRMRMRNAGSSAIEIFAPALMQQPIFDPTVGAGLNSNNEFEFGRAIPMDVGVVSSGAWGANSGRPVVALERIPAGQLGWFAINGLVPARVYTNVGLSTYNLGYCYPATTSRWEVIGGPAINGHTQVYGYKIVWQSPVIAQAGEWRWCIVDLGNYGPAVRNLFTVHSEDSGGVVSSTSTQVRTVIGIPLKWQLNGQTNPWGTFGGFTHGNNTDWYRPYVQFTSGNVYEFYRDVGLRFTITGTLALPATVGANQQAYCRVEAIIKNDNFTWPTKILTQAEIANVIQGRLDLGSGFYRGVMMPFHTTLYCPAGCYFAQNAGGGNAGRFSVRFEAFAYVVGSGTVQATGGLYGGATISCDLLHENYAAVGSHLYSAGNGGGGPQPAP